MKDIVAVGEVLIDLTQKGTDELGVGQYAANPGGRKGKVRRFIIQ